MKSPSLLLIPLIIGLFAALDVLVVVRVASVHPAAWVQEPPELVELDTLPRSPDKALGVLERITTASGASVSLTVAGYATVDRKIGFQIQGWAVDRQQMKPFLMMFVSVDRGPMQSVPYGISRPDVAQSLSCAACEFSGYSIAFAARELTVGPHSLFLRFVDPDAHGLVAGPVIRLDVHESGR